MNDAARRPGTWSDSDTTTPSFVPATTVEEVKGIADSGLYMPPKSTYFIPRCSQGSCFTNMADPVGTTRPWSSLQRKGAVDPEEEGIPSLYRPAPPRQFRSFEKRRNPFGHRHGLWYHTHIHVEKGCANRLVGIEIQEELYDLALRNRALNGCANVEFFKGDVRSRGSGTWWFSRGRVESPLCERADRQTESRDSPVSSPGTNRPSTSRRCSRWLLPSSGPAAGSI